jgi:hypothetical protein
VFASELDLSGPHEIRALVALKIAGRVYGELVRLVLKPYRSVNRGYAGNREGVVERRKIKHVAPLSWSKRVFELIANALATQRVGQIKAIIG